MCAFIDIEVQLLGKAFDRAWDRYLSTELLTPQNLSQSRLEMARRILRAASFGERDEWRLAKDAVHYLLEIRDASTYLLRWGASGPMGNNSNRDSPTMRTSNERCPSEALAWWQRAVFYQIAPLSFQDSNGDGRGDLRGIINRLDYIESLGVGAIWLCPICPSPLLDFGYDIADFTSVDPLFGTLDEFDALTEAVHQRGMKLIMDFVPNHTSDQHPWFRESRASQDNPKRDWYIWADPAENGGPPNNWLSRFGGSAWTFDAATAQYYYHSFLQEQPDLNWRNPEVRHAMADVLRFWLRRNVDGFRVDASAVLAEDDLLRDDPPNPDYDEKTTPPAQRLRRVFTDDRPLSMSYLEEIRAVVDEFPDRVLAGEVQGKIDRIGHFYGNDRPRFHLPLNFALLDAEWSAVGLQAHIDAYYNAIPDHAWPDWVIGGHDKKRLASTVGRAQARNAALLALTLKGTPFFYAGDEIGMEQVPIPTDRVNDPFEKLVPGYGLNRDPERSPMRWDGGRHGGFTTGEPWLPLGDDVAERNVATLEEDQGSILWLYRRLIALRRRTPALTAGDYHPLRSRNEILCYKRSFRDQQMLIALNTSHEPRRLQFTGVGRILISTSLNRGEEAVCGSTLLGANEGVIIELYHSV
jgi:alpha-glucosidase